VLRASLTVTLRREDWRCLLVRVHLLLLCRRGYRRVPSSWVLRAAIGLDVPGRVPMMGLLVLCVVGHVRNMLFLLLLLLLDVWEYKASSMYAT
jgi:hypothetical protein